MKTRPLPDTPIFNAMTSGPKRGDAALRSLDNQWHVARIRAVKSLNGVLQRPTKEPSAEERTAIAEENGWAS